MRYLVSFLVAILLASSPGFAKWHEASSAHFVVYADQNEKAVRTFSEQLERYHAALQDRFAAAQKSISPSNRVTIYIVRDEGALKKLYGANSKFVGGFYIPRAGGSVAFVPKVDTASLEITDSERILLHEYAHHYMFGLTDRIFPSWFTEGFAEFYSTAKFNKDGSVGLGLPAVHRGPELALSKSVPLENLLDTAAYRAKKTKEHDEFYGKSWLLYHYTYFNAERGKHLKAYLRKYIEGVPEIEAAQQGFGDLKLLSKELDKYRQQTTWSYLKITADKLLTGPINVRQLRDGEAAMMPLLIQSRRGVNLEKAQALLPEVRSVSAKFATDPTVLAALAEGEYDAGNFEEALSAADRAITLNPNEIDAHLYKGLAMAKLAPDHADADKAWSSVRKQFAKMNAIENDHPLALFQFYRTYKMQGRKPTANSIDALERALELAPFDQELRFNAASQQLEDGRYAQAIDTISPLAFSTHAGSRDDIARELLETAKAKLAAHPIAKDAPPTLPETGASPAKP